MRRVRKMSIKELVNENIRMLLSDKEALERIDKKLEERRMR